jgi:hypothetical protein
VSGCFDSGMVIYISTKNEDDTVPKAVQFINEEFSVWVG